MTSKFHSATVQQPLRLNLLMFDDLNLIFTSLLWACARPFICCVRSISAEILRNGRELGYCTMGELGLMVQLAVIKAEFG